MLTVEVSVTQEDIDGFADRFKHGDGFRCKTCPVANAIQRVLRCKNIDVGATVVTRRDIPIAYLPNSAIQFIREFDQLLHPSPFSFTLALLSDIDPIK